MNETWFSDWPFGIVMQPQVAELIQIVQIKMRHKLETLIWLANPFRLQVGFWWMYTFFTLNNANRINGCLQF